MVKKALYFLSPLIAVAATYGLLILADNAGAGWHNAAGRSSYYIYMACYLIAGAVLMLDLWFCNFAKGKIRLFLGIERLLLVGFMFFAAQNVFSMVYLGKQIWVVAAGIQLTVALLSILTAACKSLSQKAGHSRNPNSYE